MSGGSLNYLGSKIKWNPMSFDDVPFDILPANKFKIHRVTVINIVNRRTWKHI